MDERAELVAKIRNLMENNQTKDLHDLLSGLHPYDIAEILESLEEEYQVRVFKYLDDEATALTLQEMDYDDQARLLKSLGHEKAASVLDEMPADEKADLLSELPENEARELLKIMEPQEAEDVRELMGYKEDTAGGIMTTEVVALKENVSADEAIKRLREIAPDAEMPYYIYVINSEEQLVGVLSLRELITAPESKPIRDIMERNVIKVSIDTDQEKVARTVSRYDLMAIPVVDEKDRLVGIVTFDDVLDVLEEETTEDIYRMAGTGGEDAEEEFASSVWGKVRKRLPWLVILLFGDMISARVIKGFSNTLEMVVALAYFVPVLTDMGGNVGTQSFAIVVRGLATGELENKEIWRTVWKESQVGLLVGAICGLLVAAVAYIWQGIPLLGVIVGASMALTLTTSAIVGTFIPLAFDKLNVDIAVASGPFITTIVDVVGLFIYFWLATSMMHHLMY